MSGPYTGAARVRVLPPGVFGSDLDQKRIEKANENRERSPIMKTISCSLCGEKGHNKKTCPKKAQGGGVAAPKPNPVVRVSAPEEIVVRIRVLVSVEHGSGA